MKRLTNREESGSVWYCMDGEVIPTCNTNQIDMQIALNRLAEYEDIGLSPTELKCLIRDLHAIMWHSGDGCEICKHKIVKHRSPYIQISCKLGSPINCDPIWHGLNKDTGCEDDT